MKRTGTTLSALRAERERIDAAIALERQAITALRGQLTARRPVVPPSRSMARPTAVDLQAVRTALSVHQDALTRLEVRRDRLESRLDGAKAAQ